MGRGMGNEPVRGTSIVGRAMVAGSFAVLASGDAASGRVSIRAAGDGSRVVSALAIGSIVSGVRGGFGGAVSDSGTCLTGCGVAGVAAGVAAATLAGSKGGVVA